MTSVKRRAAFGGANTILTTGAILIGLSASVFAIDLPTYFAARNQLQTTVDAAALAGAYQLPTGEAEAEEAAYAMASENPVAGEVLPEDAFTYTADSSKFTVVAETKVPTIMGRLLCSMTGGGSVGDEEADVEGDDGGDGSAACSPMTVVASSSAAPAARDTILVIDTSSSMKSLGYNRPISYVQDAARKYVETIVELDTGSADRIGLVTFNQTGKLNIGLTAQQDSPAFQKVKDKITPLHQELFSGVGWNTNYEAGLKVALDELEAHGRKNAQKIVVFMTDGMPNLPAPDSYYNYSVSKPYTKCTDMVNNSQAVKNLCYYSGRKKICPTLPSSAIKDSMISSQAVACGQNYVDAMLGKTNAQTDRANNLNVLIHTVSITYTDDDDNATNVLRRLIKIPSWEPTQLAYMSMKTGGQEYETTAYNASAILALYEEIAKDIHIKLVKD